MTSWMWVHFCVAIKRTERYLSYNKYLLNKLLLALVKIVNILFIWRKCMNRCLWDTLLIKKKNLLKLSLDKGISKYLMTSMRDQKQKICEEPRKNQPPSPAPMGSCPLPSAVHLPLFDDQCTWPSMAALCFWNSWGHHLMLKDPLCLRPNSK